MQAATGGSFQPACVLRLCVSFLFQGSIPREGLQGLLTLLGLLFC